jgi:hypothetical protein
MGPFPKVGVTGVVGFDLDFPTRKMSRKAGAECFWGFLVFIEVAKS